MKLPSTDRARLINLRVVNKWSMDVDMLLNDFECQLLTHQQEGIKVDGKNYALSIRSVDLSKDLGGKLVHNSSQ